MYKVIIFDFFDVVHSDPFKRWLNQHSLERDGKLQELSDRNDYGELKDDELFIEMAEISRQSVEEIKAIFDDTSMIDQAMVDLIKELGSKYQIGLLSNCSSEYLRTILHKHSLSPLFDEIVISAEIKMIKPTPEIFNFILGQMKIKPSEALFVDDNPQNVAAAESLGIKSLQHIHLDTPKLRQQLADLGIL